MSDDGFPFEVMMGTDVDGVLRGKLLSTSKLDQPGLDFGFCGVIFGWDCEDAVYTGTELARGLSNQSCWKRANSNGYPDVIARIDRTVSPRLLYIPQQPNGLKIHLVDFHQPDQQKGPLPFCPRSTLKRALGRLETEYGLQADCGFELEWYNYRGTPSKILTSTDNPQSWSLTSGMGGYCPLRPWENALYIRDLLQACTKSDVLVECFHTETGPGVLEAALKHRLALAAADNCQLLKWLVKTVARHHGITASFMAKPWDGLPGCGGHIHTSLVRLSQNTNNSSSSSVTLENAMAKDTLLKEQFIAGILHCLPDLMPFFAPTINSYKRLDLRYWAPILVGWGRDNRLAVLRLIESEQEPASTRVEVRIGGADLNPYFALAAILEAGLFGIREKLKLPPPLDASRLHPNTDLLMEIQRLGYEALPTTLTEAVHRMMRPESVAHRLFPPELIEHFGMTRLHELKTFESTVTEWERRRYFETA